MITHAFRPRAVERLRALLVAVLVVGLALVALSAVSHTHAHGYAADETAVSAQADSDEQMFASTNVTLGSGALEAEGLCSAVTFIALVLLTIAQALIAHRPDVLPAAAPQPDRVTVGYTPRRVEASDLAALAVCRQ